MTRNYRKPEAQRRADGEALYRRHPGGIEELMAGVPKTNKVKENFIMKIASVYIFNNKEDRRNEENYKKLAELICRIDGPINTQNIAETRKADRFYKTHAESMEDNPKILPYFETRKGDLFLWVDGKYEMHDTRYLHDVAETLEEKELADKVLIGYSSHHEEGYWFRDIDSNIPRRVLGKATELMSQEKYKNDTKDGTMYYAIMNDVGMVIPWTKEEAEEAAQSKEFVNTHIVIYENTASDPNDFKKKTDEAMKRCVSVRGASEPIDWYTYYDMMFNYFLRLQWTPKTLPADFWDWFKTDGKDCFEMAHILYQTRIFLYDCSDLKTA